MKNFNQNIINSLLIIGLLVLVGGGCQQINDLTNSKTTTNTNTGTTNSNTAPNSNTKANTNSNATANSNANSSTTTNANTTTLKNDEAKTSQNNLVGQWQMEGAMEKLTITENKIEFSLAPGKLNTYRFVDEKTIEAKRESDGSIWTMKIEDDGNTLVWNREGSIIKYTRIKPN